MNLPFPWLQLVWKSTQKVGCGMATNERRTIVVCRYSPAGNSMNAQSIKQNVPILPKKPSKFIILLLLKSHTCKIASLCKRFAT